MGFEKPKAAVMIRPINFHYNLQTAQDNQFQHHALRNIDVQQPALEEFEGLVSELRKNGITVYDFDDTPAADTPDAIFPNNWFSTHPDGTLALYPMYAPNRRRERRADIINFLKDRYDIRRILDFSAEENADRFLEATGSMVFDEETRVVYAALSLRTDEDLFKRVANELGYKPICFQAVDRHRHPIYHTNVMMSVGHDYIWYCRESIMEGQQKEALEHEIASSEKKVIEVKQAQLYDFAGNIIELWNDKEQAFMVMSESAFESLKPDQRAALEENHQMIAAPLTTIERTGGGSARCMIGDIKLPVCTSD